LDFGLIPRNVLQSGDLISHSHEAVIRVFYATGNVIGTHEHASEFKEW
jgi:hypothetical protein